GTVWKRAYKSPYGRPDVTGGRPVEVTIFPEANHGKFLATLDTPVAIEGVRSRQWTDGTFLFRRSAKKPQSYRIKANLNGSLRADPGIVGEPYLQLPADVSPRTRQAARSLVASTAGREQKIEKIKEFFRERQLVYATDDLPLVDDPIDNFIFASKRGYCEYFASAFAIMLRETGVPARLVGGYLGGTFNPLGGYYIVGEKNAHVWVEVLNRQGEWLRIDPNLYAVNAETSLLARSLQQRPGWQQMADAIDYYWTQVVITFDFARQLQFLKSARKKIGDWRRSDT
ncbi:MAG: DUF3488 domain-containing transglutaminase family protein, partial [Desulfuromonadales bacterium]|nr:DUF3488 domain-containing transglutaminase family protein [Desulfuromonadales bacterium]NIS39388.1 DUF3488 domain-containing transglutaminase family protein [Desulfuromonadales bacterium]